MGVTMKSLFVIAVAGAIFALCSVGVEARRGNRPQGSNRPQGNRPRPPFGGPGGRPSRNCTVDEDCIRGDHNGTCYNNLCFLSCDSSDDCPRRKYDVCDLDNSRCVMCND